MRYDRTVLEALLAEARRRSESLSDTRSLSDMTWYRIREYDASDDWSGDYRLVLQTWLVVKETPQTVVLRRFVVSDDGSLSEYTHSDRRCSKDARRRHCHPTVELALESYWQRKRHQIARLEHQLHQARAGMAAAALIRGIRA